MDNLKLTKYPPGGIRELLAISWPMILSSASGILMIFIDRMILSYYSPEAFDACFGVMHWYWTFSDFILAFVLITEVFVGQYNGAQRYKEIGTVVWQMIWFCCALFAIFIPLAIWGVPLLVADKFMDLGVPYLRIIFLGIPINCMGTGTLAAFFVGRGETKIIPMVTLIFNVVNIFLDFLLIFGCRILPDGNVEIIPGHNLWIFKLHASWFCQEIIPSFGIIGAAIATVISQFFSMLSLFILFLRKSYRERYDTGKTALQVGLLKKCLKEGYPNALSRLIGTIALTIMTQVIIEKAVEDDVHAYGIIHTIYLLFCFVGQGMGAGVRTVCSNAFGARNFDIVRETIRSFLFLSVIFSIIVSIAMVIYPDSLMEMFSEKMMEGDVYSIVRHMQIWIWIVISVDLLFDGLMNLLLGLGDTKFPMKIYLFNFLFIAVVPTYVGIVYFQCKSVLFWQFIALNYVVCITFFTFRYRSNHWMKKQLI